MQNMKDAKCCNAIVAGSTSSKSKTHAPMADAYSSLPTIDRLVDTSTSDTRWLGQNQLHRALTFQFFVSITNDCSMIQLGLSKLQ